RRARCPRHPPGRSSRLALVHPPPRAGQYHHHSAAAEVPRAQPGRERLAVHARQLALQPHLQILRRSRRPLLCGMEQARRSALAHHVHRTAPMGPRVLINGIWYYIVCATKELLEDSGVAIEPWLFDKASRAFRVQISAAVINGDGFGKPMGILNPAAGIPIVETAPASPAGAFSWQDLILMRWQLPQNYQD